MSSNRTNLALFDTNKFNSKKARGKRIAIMQPYFLPYLGYWQLISCVDEFVLYDDIQYTKKGWMTRNRLSVNGQEKLFSLQVKKDSSYLPVSKRFLADAFSRKKLLSCFQEAYRKAPFFDQVFPLLQRVINLEETNLFNYLFHSINEIKEYLAISTPIILSSDIAQRDLDLSGQDMVLNICQALSASDYVNPIGGVSLYSKSEFATNSINLQFLESSPIEYQWCTGPAQPFMSIIDVLMFNPKETVITALPEFKWK
jgi:hypothetical protein